MFLIYLHWLSPLSHFAFGRSAVELEKSHKIGFLARSSSLSTLLSVSMTYFFNTEKSLQWSHIEVIDKLSFRCARRITTKTHSRGGKRRGEKNLIKVVTRRMRRSEYVVKLMLDDPICALKAPPKGSGIISYDARGESWLLKAEKCYRPDDFLKCFFRTKVLHHRTLSIHSLAADSINSCQPLSAGLLLPHSHH